MRAGRPRSGSVHEQLLCSKNLYRRRQHPDRGRLARLMRYLGSKKAKEEKEARALLSPVFHSIGPIRAASAGDNPTDGTGAGNARLPA